MKYKCQIKYWKTKLFVVFVIAIAISAVLGFRQYRQREIMKQELNLDGLFVNIKGVDISTSSARFSSKKPYASIKIKIPSIASTGDDAIKENDNEINQIIDREKLGKDFENWLKVTFNSSVAKNYTEHIEVWYRDNKIIDENYKK